MIIVLPAELGVEGVCRNCANRVLGIKEVNVVRSDASEGEFAFDLLLEEAIKR